MDTVFTIVIKAKNEKVAANWIKDLETNSYKTGIEIIGLSERNRLQDFQTLKSELTKHNLSPTIEQE